VLEHRAANVVADVGELVRFAELHGDVIPKMNDPGGGWTTVLGFLRLHTDGRLERVAPRIRLNAPGLAARLARNEAQSYVPPDPWKRYRSGFFSR
jgi:alpha-D-ribose 1-methylphosphonate 5-triphosphate diphosphatase PhnM